MMRGDNGLPVSASTMRLHGDTSVVGKRREFTENSNIEKRQCTLHCSKEQAC